MATSDGVHTKCTRMHSSRMRTTRSSSCPGGVFTRHTPRGSTPQRKHPLEEAQPPTPQRKPPRRRHPPPRGQNHRRLWKYNLAPTSLRAVINLQEQDGKDQRKTQKQSLRVNGPFGTFNIDIHTWSHPHMTKVNVKAKVNFLEIYISTFYKGIYSCPASNVALTLIFSLCAA